MVDPREGLKQRNKRAKERAWLIKQKCRRERRARRNVDKGPKNFVRLPIEAADLPTIAAAI